jgi:hypothetical protein
MTAASTVTLSGTLGLYLFTLYLSWVMLGLVKRPKLYSFQELFMLLATMWLGWTLARVPGAKDDSLVGRYVAVLVAGLEWAALLVLHAITGGLHELIPSIPVLGGT